MWILWMDDEEPDHSHHLLHRSVRVVEERSILMEREFVGEHLPRLDQRLTYIRLAIHLDWDLKPVPVNRRIFRQLIVKDYPYTVAFVHFDRWPWHAAVVPPHIDDLGRSHRIRREKLTFDDLGRQMKDLHAAFHLPGKLRKVGSKYRNVPGGS